MCALGSPSSMRNKRKTTSGKKEARGYWAAGHCRDRDSSSMRITMIGPLCATISALVQLQGSEGEKGLARDGPHVAG